MWRARAVIAIVLALLAAGLQADTASAAGLIGEVYVDKTGRVPAGEQRSLKVACPNGRPVLSGGTLVSGTDPGLSVASNGPADGPDRDRRRDDAWFGAISNDSPDNQTMFVRAQCARRSYRTLLEYIGFKDVVSPGGIYSFQQQCPTGLSVVGAGLVTERAFRARMFESIPIDGGDGDAFRNDAWRSGMHNRSDKRLTVNGTMICGDLASTGPVTSMATVGSVGPVDQESASVTCPPSNVALGGGIGEASATIAKHSIASIWSSHTGETATGWTGWLNNLGQTSSSFVVASVCLNPF